MPGRVRRNSAKNQSPALGFRQASAQLSGVVRDFYARGWALGTSGNYSAVVRRKPLRVAITPSQADKGTLTAGQILELDEKGRVVRGAGRPTSEAALHLAIIGTRGAGAVLHTHSVWSTLLSDACARRGGLALEGYEMLKGLQGITTHRHWEWLPIVENSQNWEKQAPGIERLLRRHPGSHGFLIRRHGLYTWGKDLPEAKRHAEILEFLLEVFGRSHGAARSGPAPAGL